MKLTLQKTALAVVCGKFHDIQASGTGGGNRRMQCISFDFAWMLKLQEGDQSGHQTALNLDRRSGYTSVALSMIVYGRK